MQDFDRLLDAICRFDRSGTGFACGDTEGTVCFETTWGDTTQGSGGIKTARSACR